MKFINDKKKYDYFIQNYEESIKKRKEEEELWNEIDSGFESIGSINLFNKLLTVKLSEYNIEHFIPEIRPIQYDKKNIKKSKTLDSVIKGLWEILQIPKNIRDTVKNSTKYGTAITKIYWDSEVKTMNGISGQIKFKNIPLDSFFIDPSANSIKTALFMGYTSKLKYYELINDPILTNKDNEEILTKLKSAWNESQDIENKDLFQEIKIHHYYSKITGNYEKYIIYELKNNNQKKEGDKTYILVQDDYNVLFFPFVACFYDKSNTKKFYGDSLFKYTSKLIKIQNEISRAIQEKALLSTKQIFLYNVDLLDDPTLLTTKIEDYFEKGKDISDIKRFISLPVKNISQGQNKISDVFQLTPMTEYDEKISSYYFMKNEEIENNMHINKISTGISSGSVSTTGGIKHMIDRATLIPKYLSNNIKDYIKDFILIFVKFISNYHKTKIKIPINTPEYNTDNFVEYIGTDFEKLGYDINTEIIPLSAAERIQQREDTTTIFSIMAQNQQDGKNTSLVNTLLKPLINSMQLLNKKDIINKIEAQEVSYRYNIAQQIYNLSKYFSYKMFIENYEAIISEILTMRYQEKLDKAKDKESLQKIKDELAEIRENILSKIKIPAELSDYFPPIAVEEKDLIQQIIIIMDKI